MSARARLDDYIKDLEGSLGVAPKVKNAPIKQQGKPLVYRAYGTAVQQHNSMFSSSFVKRGHAHSVELLLCFVFGLFCRARCEGIRDAVTLLSVVTFALLCTIGYSVVFAHTVCIIIGCAGDETCERMVREILELDGADIARCFPHSCLVCCAVILVHRIEL